MRLGVHFLATNLGYSFGTAMVELRNPAMVMNISERRTRKERGRIRRVLVTPCLGGAYRGERDDEGIANLMEHARDSEDVWHAKQGKWCERCPGE